MDNEFASETTREGTHITCQSGAAKETEKRKSQAANDQKKGKAAAPAEEVQEEQGQSEAGSGASGSSGASGKSAAGAGAAAESPQAAQRRVVQQIMELQRQVWRAQMKQALRIAGK